MSQAVTCPICGGSGKYTPPNDYQSTAAPMPQPCHGCDGKGWVDVGGSYPPPPGWQEYMRAKRAAAESSVRAIPCRLPGPAPYNWRPSAMTGTMTV